MWMWVHMRTINSLKTNLASFVLTLFFNYLHVEGLTDRKSPVQRHCQSFYAQQSSQWPLMLYQHGHYQSGVFSCFWFPPWNGNRSIIFLSAGHNDNRKTQISKQKQEYTSHITTTDLSVLETFHPQHKFSTWFNTEMAHSRLFALTPTM